MAISPIVNSFMQQGQQQEEQPSDAGQIFRNRFADMAYNSFRSKFPGLLNLVVTFRTMASDLDEATAFGVFILDAGDQLVHVPVAMSAGSISSCEMVYDKESDQFFQLNEHTAKEILNKRQLSGASMLSGNQRVEDTRALFHNMFRPPRSSNVVLAGERGGISSLPDVHKLQVSRYLLDENPQLLGKLASFYDVCELAVKLAPTDEQVKTACDSSLPEFLRLDTLTKDMAGRLAPAERKELLKVGYLVRLAEDAPGIVAAPDKLKAAVEQELGLSLYSPEKELGHKGVKDTPVLQGELLEIGNEGLSFTPVLISGTDIYGYDGKHRSLIMRGEGVLVRNLRPLGSDAPACQLLVPFSSLGSKVNQLASGEWCSLEVMVPMRNGWKMLVSGVGGSPDKLKLVDDCIISDYGPKVRVVDAIKHGYVRASDGAIAVPRASRFVLSVGFKRDQFSPVSSYDALLRAMQIFGTDITVSNDGAGISINESGTHKTASFASHNDAAQWLHERFGMNSAQIGYALSQPRVSIFTKQAFMDPLPEQMNPQPTPYDANQAPQDAPPVQGEMPAQQPQEEGDLSNLDDFAQMEDPEMFDVGVLSAFANSPDVKSLLVEYLPDFLAAEDKVGRIILLFSAQQKRIEDFYGADKAQNLMGSCRRIFGILSEIISSLKLYANMG